MINPFLNEFSFPHSKERGASREGISVKKMQQRVFGNSPLGEAEIREMIHHHQQFLQEGGAGGKWRMILVDGIVIALYQLGRTTKATQFNLEYRSLEKNISLYRQQLPFSNCTAANLKNLDASETDFSHSSFTDTELEGANFSKSNLSLVDFSRANLKGVNLQGANLSYADFENCDLQGADFRGARIVGARFPGALLKGVII